MKVWISREDEGLFLYKNNPQINDSDEIDYIKLDNNQFPEVTIENSPREIYLNLSNNMEIKQENINAALEYVKGNPELESLLKILFGKKEEQKIETFTDAYNKLKDGDQLMPEYDSIDHVIFPNVNAYSKLCIICKALNNNEIPINGTMYYPCFSIITDVPTLLTRLRLNLFLRNNFKMM